MTKVKHGVHKYYKAKLGKKIIYRCAVPDCSHYILRELAPNRMSLCWNCNSPFVLPKAVSLLTSKPWCPECAKTRKVGEVEKVEVPADVMDKILSNF